jgi:hypothetical protein
MTCLSFRPEEVAKGSEPCLILKFCGVPSDKIPFLHAQVNRGFADGDSRDHEGVPVEHALRFEDLTGGWQRYGRYVTTLSSTYDTATGFYRVEIKVLVGLRAKLVDGARQHVKMGMAYVPNVPLKHLAMASGWFLESNP